jgi:hypothetical protein
MAMQFLLYNGAMPTTSSAVKVATGASIKTMMQVFLGATPNAKIVEWGASFDASAAATPGVVELIETDVAATVTAYAAADITAYNAEALLLTSSQKAAAGTTGIFQISTSTSGFTASAEGSITATRFCGAPQLIAPTTQFIQQFPLGRDGLMQNGKYYRIRMTFGSTVNALCYIIIEV